ncbi:hypothetical protein ACFQBN_43175 [Cohnella cellulosilytica]
MAAAGVPCYPNGIPTKRINEIMAADLSKAMDAGDELAANILRSAGT